jgi:hypothetical protein
MTDKIYYVKSLQNIQANQNHLFGPRLRIPYVDFNI